MNKQELKYIIYTGVFAIVWFFLALPFLSKHFDGKSPLFQFFIFNLGLFALLFIFLKTITLKTSTSIISSLGLTSLFLSLDSWLPPYAVDFSGKIIQANTLFYVSSTDYIWGLLGSSIGIHGILLFGFTYVVVPLALLYLAAKLLPNFVQHI